MFWTSDIQCRLVPSRTCVIDTRQLTEISSDILILEKYIHLVRPGNHSSRIHHHCAIEAVNYTVHINFKNCTHSMWCCIKDTEFHSPCVNKGKTTQNKITASRRQSWNESKPSSHRGIVGQNFLAKERPMTGSGL